MFFEHSSKTNDASSIFSKRPLDDLSMLVVEDERVIAMGIRQAFQRGGAGSVAISRTMKDAWNTIKQTKFDAVLLDIRLPDGYSFPLAIELFSKGVPVVMHSGHTQIFHSSKLPGIIFCPKPATPEELIVSVMKAQELSAEKSAPLVS